MNDIISKIKKAAGQANQTRELVLEEIASIDAKLKEKREQRERLHTTPMTKEDYLNFLLADVDARFNANARRKAKDLLSTFNDKDAQSLRCSATPPTLAGMELRAKNDGCQWMTEAIFGRQSRYGNETDLYCFLSRDSVKDAIRATVEMIEWPFDSALMEGGKNTILSRMENQPGLTLAPSRPITELLSERNALDAELAELEAQRATLVSEAETLGITA
jgi:hypothetical protein